MKIDYSLQRRLSFDWNNYRKMRRIYLFCRIRETGASLTEFIRTPWRFLSRRDIREDSYLPLLPAQKLAQEKADQAKYRAPLSREVKRRLQHRKHGTNPESSVIEIVTDISTIWK